MPRIKTTLGAILAEISGQVVTKDEWVEPSVEQEPEKPEAADESRIAELEKKARFHYLRADITDILAGQKPLLGMFEEYNRYHIARGLAWHIANEGIELTSHEFALKVADKFVGLYSLKADVDRTQFRAQACRVFGELNEPRLGKELEGSDISDEARTAELKRTIRFHSLRADFAELLANKEPILNNFQVYHRYNIAWNLAWYVIDERIEPTSDEFVPKVADKFISLYPLKEGVDAEQFKADLSEIAGQIKNSLLTGGLYSRSNFMYTLSEILENSLGSIYGLVNGRKECTILAYKLTEGGLDYKAMEDMAYRILMNAIKPDVVGCMEVSSDFKTIAAAIDMLQHMAAIELKQGRKDEASKTLKLAKSATRSLDGNMIHVEDPSYCRIASMEIEAEMYSGAEITIRHIFSPGVRSAKYLELAIEEAKSGGILANHYFGKAVEHADDTPDPIMKRKMYSSISLEIAEAGMYEKAYQIADKIDDEGLKSDLKSRIEAIQRGEKPTRFKSPTMVERLYSEAKELIGPVTEEENEIKEYFSLVSKRALLQNYPAAIESLTITLKKADASQNKIDAYIAVATSCHNLLQELKVEQ